MRLKKSAKIISVVLCTILMITAVSVVASADCGPKPSVVINFLNLDDELCYGTLLSKEKFAGPSDVWNGKEEYAHRQVNGAGDETLDYEIWKAFVDYQDSDGYYYLQECWQVNESKMLAWGYAPPENFKILLYWPESDTFEVSEICKSFAFDSYFTVDMDGVRIKTVGQNEETDEPLEVRRSYNLVHEILALAARIGLTFLLEVMVAVPFKLCEKKQLLLILVVNIITQVFLNVLLNVIHFSTGSIAAIAYYVLLELLIVAIEAAVYCTLLKKVSEQPRKNGYYILYSLIANIASFGAGFIISYGLPSIF